MACSEGYVIHFRLIDSQLSPLMYHIYATYGHVECEVTNTPVTSSPPSTYQGVHSSKWYSISTQSTYNIRFVVSIDVVLVV